MTLAACLPQEFDTRQGCAPRVQRRDGGTDECDVEVASENLDKEAGVEDKGRLARAARPFPWLLPPVVVEGGMLGLST